MSIWKHDIKVQYLYNTKNVLVFYKYTKSLRKYFESKWKIQDKEIFVQACLISKENRNLFLPLLNFTLHPHWHKLHVKMNQFSLDEVQKKKETDKPNKQERKKKERKKERQK